MWGDIVAWNDCRNDPENSAECWNREWDVYMKDLSTGEERRLIDLPWWETLRTIYENRIYFLKWDLERITSVFEITI